MKYVCKEEGCGFESVEEINYCPKCGHNIEAVDEEKTREEERKKEEATKLKDAIENDIIRQFNAIVCDKETAKLLSNGWEMKQTPISKLKGMKNLKSRFSFGNKEFVACIAEGEIDSKHKVAEYTLEYLEIAKKLGAETIIVMEKDYPCYGKLPNGRFIVIAPRVE
jgi:uncharacterized Zn finger protein (UPF0148 family)